MTVFVGDNADKNCKDESYAVKSTFDLTIFSIVAEEKPAQENEKGPMHFDIDSCYPGYFM